MTELTKIVLPVIKVHGMDGQDVRSTFNDPLDQRSSTVELIDLKGSDHRTGIG